MEDLLSGMEPLTPFVLLAVEDANVDPTLKAPLDLGDGFSAFFRTDGSLPEHWVRWLGTFQADHLRRSNLILRYISPEIVHVRSNLHETIRRVFYGILLQGLPGFSGGLILSGRCSDNSPAQTSSITSIAPLLTHYRTNGEFPFQVTEEALRHATRIASGLAAVWNDEERHQRLRGGVSAWLKAVLDRYTSERLHEFVRALDAVLLLGKQKGRSNFIERGQFLVGRSKLNAKKLCEIYRLRNAEEHLRDILNELNMYKDDRAAILSLRAFQAGEIASYALSTILSCPELRTNFADDANIERFWSLPQGDRRKIWPCPPLDLKKRTEDRFGIDSLSVDTMIREGLWTL